MTQLQWLEVALLAAMGTYALRGAPFLIVSRYEISGALKDFLAYTSLAIIAGIVSKALLATGPGEGPAETGIKLGCLAVAVGLFIWRKSVMAPLMAAVILAVILKMAI